MTLARINQMKNKINEWKWVKINEFALFCSLGWVPVHNKIMPREHTVAGGGVVQWEFAVEVWNNE